MAVTDRPPSSTHAGRLGSATKRGVWQKLDFDDDEEIDAMSVAADGNFIVFAGASGKVYKAYHGRTASIVALKVISVFDRTVRRQMMKELKANVMHASNVPNMCGFLGAYYDEGSVSMALE